MKKKTRLGMALTATTAVTSLFALTACGSSGSSTAAAAAAGTASSSGAHTFTIATQEGGDPSVDITITELTLDKLRSEGWNIKETDFTSPETLAQAMQQGHIDIGIVAAGTEFSSIDAGMKAKVFLALNSTDYQLVAKKGLTSCQDLNGKVLGIESREGTTGSLVAAWLKTPDCAGVTPKLTVVPGSSNRVAGMLAGQVDASAIDLQNTVELNQKSKDFVTIPSFAQSSQLAASFYASDQWLTANASLVKTFDKTYVDILQQGYADPSIIKNEAAKLVPDMDATTRNEVIDQWVKLKLWDPVSGVQPAYINSALKLYSAATPYKTVKSAADVSTTEYVAGLPGL
jgi:NitT/TauT family transport system substrate-binding protein